MTGTTQRDARSNERLRLDGDKASVSDVEVEHNADASSNANIGVIVKTKWAINLRITIQQRASSAGSSGWGGMCVVSVIMSRHTSNVLRRDTSAALLKRSQAKLRR